MAKDASFEVVDEIVPHPNADRLEIAKISGWNVIIGKGEFKAGDVVFYIREDAKLLEYDAAKSTPDYKFKYPWQKDLLKYLGSNGRVKTVKLRGEYSSGIAVSLDKLFAHINVESAKDWKADNEKLNSEHPGGFLSGKYGVKHWEAPVAGMGPMNAKGGLPFGIPKTDEENFQNLRERDIPYGEKVLLTKKLDGTSTTIIAMPDGATHVCCRSMELDEGFDNVYNRAAIPVIPLAKAWAKHYGKPIALRGETVAKNVQKFSFNKDKEVDVPTFNLFGVYMFEEKKPEDRLGLYGSEYHFLNVAKQIKELTGKEIKTVPVIGEYVLTKELLNEYLNKPLEFGEGIVINTTKNHFKCKSLAYLEALSKN